MLQAQGEIAGLRLALAAKDQCILNRELSDELQSQDRMRPRGVPAEETD